MDTRDGSGREGHARTLAGPRREHLPSRYRRPRCSGEYPRFSRPHSLRTASASRLGLRRPTMDPTAFIALAERCAPSAEPRLLAGLVQRASGYEPLAFQFDNGPRGPMKLLGSSKAEAIQLATELVIAGHRVRVGLAGIDTKDLDKLRGAVAKGLNPCSNMRAAGRRMSEGPAKLKPSATPGQADARPSAKAPL